MLTNAIPNLFCFNGIKECVCYIFILWFRLCLLTNNPFYGKCSVSDATR